MADGYHGDEYLYNAISGLGSNLGQAIAQYHQRHEQANVLDAEMEQLTHIMDVPDKYGNRNPVLDPKAYERIKAHNWRERQTLEVAALQAMEFGTQLQQAHANINKALASDRYGSYENLYDPQGNLVAQRNSRTGRLEKVPTLTHEAGDTSALRKHANTILAGQGQTSQGFLGRKDEEKGYMQPDPSTGKLTGEFTKKHDPKEYNAVRYKVGDRTYKLPMNDFDALTKIYPREGDPGYVDPVRVGQPQGGGAPKYPVGTKARFGNTWKIMTDQGWVPSQPPNQPNTAAIGPPTQQQDAGP